MSSASIALSGCSSTDRIVVERIEPAQVDLEGVRRLGVTSFTGEGGSELSRLISVELSDSSSLEESAIESGPTLNVARLKELGLDAALVGKVELLEGPETRDPKKTWEPKPARIRVRYHVVRRDGPRTTAPPIDLTIPARDIARAEAGWKDLLLRRAARLVVRGLQPHTVTVEVEWESAGDWGEEAQASFEAGDYAAAGRLLQRDISRAQDSGADELTLGALYYDMALCLDLAGDWPAAERSYDEALTLAGSELHIQALQAFRERLRRLGGVR